MEKKKNYTPEQQARAKYEIVHKEEREQATKQYNTRLPINEFNEIVEFLKKNHISKVDLIRAGYVALRTKFEKLKE